MPPHTLSVAIAILAAAGSALGSEYSVFNQHPDPTRTADGTWEVHDKNRPWPPSATPKPWAELEQGAKPPSGAQVLFDGSTLEAWNLPQPWILEKGILQVRPVNPSLASKQPFGSCRLHLEWRTPPENSKKSGQDRGNSGVFLMSTYEIQVLDTHENKTHADGMAAALYGVKPLDAAALPLLLQNHHEAVEFRNIWIQPLPDDAVLSPAGPVAMNK